MSSNLGTEGSCVDFSVHHDDKYSLKMHVLLLWT
jgi:hypothetical protein